MTDLLISPFANHRDLCLLLAGIAIGLLLGPMVLGRAAPQTYQSWFVGGVEAKAALDDFNVKAELRRQRLEATGVTPTAIIEMMEELKEESLPLRMMHEKQRQGHMRRLSNRMTALVLAVVLVMMLETFCAPRPQPDGPPVVPAALSRLIAIRYALIAVWVALALAAPSTLRQTPLLFFVLLLVVALFVGFVPLGRKA